MECIYCSNYRNISILPHGLNIILGIIKERNKIKMEQYLSKDQFGFRIRLEKRKAIIALRMILE